MQSQSQKPTFKKLKALSLITTALISLNLSGCATEIPIPETISDMPFCAPLPLNSDGTGNGADCDDLLTSFPQSLNQAQWQKLQDTWLSQGGVLECTNSNSVEIIKVFVEDVCNQITCNEAQKAKILAALTKIWMLRGSAAVMLGEQKRVLR